MKRMKKISIRKRMLISMLIFTLLPVCFVAMIATAVSYRTMRSQLIYDHRMSSGWLQNRLELELTEMLNRFYTFEVNKEIKADILTWCTQNQQLDYSAQWQLITEMNTLISMDSRLNSIELYNLAGGEVLIAERSGARMERTGDALEQWLRRDPELQTNLVYIRDGKEILAIHQIHRFDDKLPIALVVEHFRPYQLQEILAEIKTVPEETILVFNDENQIIEADFGTGWKLPEDTAEQIRAQLASGEKKETAALEHFWFYRGVRGGKLQLLLIIPNHTIVNALRPMTATSIVSAVLAVLASIICAILYSRTISRPICRLSDEMKKVTIDAYHDTDLESREDEIGILQDSFNQMLRRNKELVAQQYQVKLEKRNAQLRALQAQINPHFMYNTLQVIGGMALEKDASEIYSVTTALGDIMRYSLNFSREMVTLEEEVQYLQSYVMIQNARFGGKVRLVLELQEDTLRCMIPKLILQPLAENSFEHGFLNKTGTWVLTVKSERRGEKDLFLSVTDNGVGFAREDLEALKKRIEEEMLTALKSGSHIGLANVYARIKLRGSEERYGLHVESSPGAGTTVYACLPFNTEERTEETGCIR